MEKLKSVEKLTDAFSKLPGVGHKSAEKMAYSVLDMSDEDVELFSSALKDAKRKVHKCPECGILTENDICEICSDKGRHKDRIIVVSYPKDVLGFEKLATYDGVYHVLGGTLSAVNGVGVDDLAIVSLLERIKRDNVKEVILATNPTIDGETTALYIAKLLESTDVEVSRLAYGLPMGGHLEYADSLTLSKALEGRKKI
ncbi:MAG: recombination mediator RecR [Bacilli bacterium]|nr:recombination mediator RecR [Bacilli bacterium]